MQINFFNSLIKFFITIIINKIEIYFHVLDRINVQRYKVKSCKSYNQLAISIVIISNPKISQKSTLAWGRSHLIYLPPIGTNKSGQLQSLIQADTQPANCSKSENDCLGNLHSVQLLNRYRKNVSFGFIPTSNMLSNQFETVKSSYPVLVPMLLSH